MTSTGPDLSWHPLHRVGGLSAMVFVVLALVPVVLVFAAPVPPAQGRALLEFIAAHRALYLTQLVCFVGLAITAMVVFAAGVASRPCLPAVGGPGTPPRPQRCLNVAAGPPFDRRSSSWHVLAPTG